MPDLPDNVIGFRASGKLTAEDYGNVLIPTVDETLKTKDKLKMLYIVSEDCAGFSAGAVWEDLKVSLGHVNRWEKVAIVSDNKWQRHSFNFFGYAVPGKFKAFALEEEAAARSWIAI